MDDPQAFIFTLKNPHGVEPTRFMKRRESWEAITCDYWEGPMFGGDDIIIPYDCNRENCCYVHNNGEGGYDCHPQYKSSLFVNTAGLNEENYFTLLDYEVFTHS